MRRLILAATLLLAVSASAFAYKLIYKEQLYPLIQYQLYMYPEDWAENIQWLDMALHADFANPLYAIARISNDKEWEFYRDLFMMHLNLQMVVQYLQWGNEYNKQEAYFYNYPWKAQNLDSLNTAEGMFKYALNYWTEAKKWSDKAAAFKWMSLPRIQYWQDESDRIQSGDLDYRKIVDKFLTKLDQVRKTFQQMGPSTY